MSNKIKTRPASAGIGAGTIILIVLSVLKLTGAVQLSWPIVILSSLIPMGLYIAFLLILAVVAAFLFGFAALADSVKRKR